MKTQSANFFNEISKAHMVSLTSEVKETLAFDHFEKKDRIFSAVDVWNIQRQKRSRIQRRFSL